MGDQQSIKLPNSDCDSSTIGNLNKNSKLNSEKINSDKKSEINSDKKLEDKPMIISDIISDKKSIFLCTYW